MTASPADDRRNGAAPTDLSSTFGGAAASSLRGLLVRRTQRVPVADGTDARAYEPPAEKPGNGHTEMTHPPRRSHRVVRVRDREHIDLLLLAATSAGPATGRQLLARIAGAGAETFMLPTGSAHRELHRLARERLVQADRQGGVLHYSLTSLGLRVLRTRRRAREAYSRRLDLLLRDG
ncbi:MAG: hypothetical protein QOH08_148 [Chloroflexota bacterium]|jgi:DNA-binding PadR family transcriptional regulator|nr:hypothetical protein [Chloroflexota bacterium]